MAPLHDTFIENGSTFCQGIIKALFSSAAGRTAEQRESADRRSPVATR
jgi:hypothetical protein